MIKISPSILSADFAKLGQEIIQLEKGGADMIHIDVMDGHYVPNLTIGPCVIKSIRSTTKLPFDVHLMIENPDIYIKSYADAGADIITIHPETTSNVAESIKYIKSLGKLAGISLSPSTSSEILESYINDLDLILIMTVAPGFAGQSFMYNQLEKITLLSNKIKNANLDIIISVDGGINEHTAPACVTAGASMLVAGSFIFKDGNYKTKIELLKTI